MAEQPKYVDVVTYLTVEPKFNDGRSLWGRDDQGRPLLEGGRVVSATTKRPERKSRTGTIVTQVTLRIEAAAFLPLMPQAVIHIGASDVEVIEVKATDPSYPQPDPADGDQP